MWEKEEEGGAVCVSMEAAHCTTVSISSFVKGRGGGLLNH